MKLDELSAHFRDRSPYVLVVMDGWGLGVGVEGNAIAQANLPNIERLQRDFPRTQLYTHGTYVGLPSDKDIGGSEVGHMTMGAGRIMPQGPTRIQQAMKSGEFFRSEALEKLIDNCLDNETPLHLIGLFSDGSVHSHIDHFYKVIDHALKQGVTEVYIHALLDGRDVGYQSALDYVEPMEKHLREINATDPELHYSFASGGGREVITMDRDRNWAKVQRGWETHVLGRCDNRFASASEAIRHFREQTPDAVDQDLPPFVVADEDGMPVGPIKDGASVIFMNFRGDRAVELTRAFVEDDFGGFEREGRPDVLFAGMMTYDEDTNMPPLTLMTPGGVERPFGRRILEQGLSQFRLAETQKYGHVTFFFNGGRREPWDPEKELYHLIPSDRVDSFAEKPEMKALEIGEKADELIRSGKYHFGLINFANADMVGHTGDLGAAVRAVEAVDKALGRVMAAIEAIGGVALITADHGNAEEMVIVNAKTGKREPGTKHTLNPVPVYLFDPAYTQENGYRLRACDPEHPLTLASLAATGFILLGLSVPEDVDPSIFDVS